MGAALAGAGHALTGITSGSDDDRVEAILPGLPVLPPEEVVRRSELVVIAVPHDQLAGLVAGLADVGAWQPGQLVLHTDPAYGVEVLAPALRCGAIPLAVHPAIVFTGASSIDLRQLAQAYAAVIAETDRPAYAEAVATATQFSRSIVRQSATLLAGVGVENTGAYLSALVRSSVDHALVEGTGPAGADGVPPDATIDG